MGKASFAHLLDGSGKIQIYVRIDSIGADAYAAWKKLDIGDIVGVTGKVFVTHMGEVSVAADSVTLLAKALLPLPEKFHGLKDNDLRYRQRYVDLIANPEVKETFVARSKIITAIRAYLDKEGFMEVETPILNTVAGGAAAAVRHPPQHARHRYVHAHRARAVLKTAHRGRIRTGVRAGPQFPQRGNERQAQPRVSPCSNCTPRTATTTT